jgi:hypothetical protein
MSEHRPSYEDVTRNDPNKKPLHASATVVRTCRSCKHYNDLCVPYGPCKSWEKTESEGN